MFGAIQELWSFTMQKKLIISDPKIMMGKPTTNEVIMFDAPNSLINL